ncbi:MAG TPA: DUF4173 domain-containing protein [Pyrinomonadaceae bacterium]|jgi:hypothetical protein|nr:DUF4173 domain-containing protein [Pyrinomonadaceae bacterium]
MNTRSKIGIAVLQVALIIGVLGDVLLRATPWGLNVLLFNTVFVAAVAYLAWRRDASGPNAQTVGLLIAQLFFASMFVVRDSIELRIADTLAILLILAVQLVPRMSVVPRLAGLFHYALGFFWSSLNAFIAPFALLFSDIEWGGLPTSGWRKHSLAGLRGLAIATPLVLIFGGLFMAADSAYEGLVQRVFNVDLTFLFKHAVLFAVFAWLSAGYLRGVMIGPLGAVVVDWVSDAPESEEAELHKTKFSDVAAEAGEPAVTLPDDHTVVEHLNISDAPNAETIASEETTDPKAGWEWADLSNSVLPQAFTLGTTEVAIILGLMNLLFLSFVIVQIPYLFGGMELVQNTPDFKLAVYARRGFGELVTVSALVLPTLLVGQWLIRKEAARAQTLFKVLAGSQIVLLFVIMASAVERLVILTGPLGYGLTTVRLYPMIFMTWLAVVFIWFGVTVLRGMRQYFAWGALWSAFFVLGITHALNPDAFIVRTNLALMSEGREFDSSYNSDLSDDAIPALIDGFPDMNGEQQIRVLGRLTRRYCESFEETDLRSWNMSRASAARRLHSIGSLADQYGGCEEVQLPSYGLHD